MIDSYGTTMKKPNYTPKCFSIDSNSSHCVLSMQMICSCRMWLLQAPKKCRMIGMDRQPTMGGYFLGGASQSLGVSINGDTQNGLFIWRKTPQKWMIWGYPYFRKPPIKWSIHVDLSHILGHIIANCTM